MGERLIGGLVIAVCGAAIVAMFGFMYDDYKSSRRAMYAECEMRMRAAKSLADSLAVHGTIPRMALGDTCGKVLAERAK